MILTWVLPIIASCPSTLQMLAIESKRVGGGVGQSFS